MPTCSLGTAGNRTEPASLNQEPRRIHENRFLVEPEVCLPCLDVNTHSDASASSSFHHGQGPRRLEAWDLAVGFAWLLFQQHLEKTGPYPKPFQMQPSKTANRRVKSLTHSCPEGNMMPSESCAMDASQIALTRFRRASAASLRLRRMTGLSEPQPEDFLRDRCEARSSTLAMGIERRCTPTVHHIHPVQRNPATILCKK